MLSKRLIVVLILAIAALSPLPVTSGGGIPVWQQTCGDSDLDLLSLLLVGNSVGADLGNPNPTQPSSGTLVVDATMDGTNYPIGVPLTVGVGMITTVTLDFPPGSTLVVHGVSICGENVTGIVEAPDPVQVSEDEEPAGEGTGNERQLH